MLIPKVKFVNLFPFFVCATIKFDICYSQIIKQTDCAHQKNQEFKTINCESCVGAIWKFDIYCVCLLHKMNAFVFAYLSINKFWLTKKLLNMHDIHWKLDFFCLPPGFLPVVGQTERWCCLLHLARPCYVALGWALICSHGRPAVLALSLPFGWWFFYSLIIHFA